VSKELQQAAKGRPPRAYAYALAREPIAWGSALVAVLVGAATASALAIPTVAALTAAACIAARRPAVQRYLDGRRVRELVRRRRDAREARLEEANVKDEGLTAATRLVDQIAQRDPLRAAALDLEGLLDRYAEIAIASARCRGALATANVRRLQRLHDSLDERSPRRAVIQRRLAMCAEYQVRCMGFDDELAAIRELIALAAQQAAAGPDTSSALGAAIDERLAYLEAIDAGEAGDPGEADEADEAGDPRDAP
jgi:hypothetical protein